MDAKKSLPPVPTKPPENQTQVAKRGEAKSPAVPDLESVMRDKMLSVTRADFFKVGSKNVNGQWEDVLEPSARVVQKWALDNNGHPISTKILEAVLPLQVDSERRRESRDARRSSGT